MLSSRNRLSKHKVMAKVQDFIQQSGNTPIHITQLTEAADTSDRTLLNVFQDYYGIEPRQYLLLRQLHQLYMTLYFANPAETHVAEIMIRNGIWEFGRFSGRYKKQFGELPKQTLARVPDRYLPHIIARMQSKLPAALERYAI
jgi:AraC family ethanolamine operon transcriptional activator